MRRTSPEVDAYIARSAECARPILERIRAVAHEAVPDLEETLRWKTPHFDHAGALAGMAAFKEHVSFGFWKGALLSDPGGLFRKVGSTAITERKLEKLSALPPKEVLAAYIQEAARLNDEGVKAPREPHRQRRGVDGRRQAAQLEVREAAPSAAGLTGRAATSA